MVTAVTVTVRQTHKLILCKLYTFYAKVIYFWSITHILIKTSHCARYGVLNLRLVAVSQVDYGYSCNHVTATRQFGTTCVNKT